MAGRVVAPLAVAVVEASLPRPQWKLCLALHALAAGLHRLSAATLPSPVAVGHQRLNAAALPQPLAVGLLLGLSVRIPPVAVDLFLSIGAPIRKRAGIAGGLLHSLGRGVALAVDGVAPECFPLIPFVLGVADIAG